MTKSDRGARDGGQQSGKVSGSPPSHHWSGPAGCDRLRRRTLVRVACARTDPLSRATRAYSVRVNGRSRPIWLVRPLPLTVMTRPRCGFWPEPRSDSAAMTRPLLITVDSLTSSSETMSCSATRSPGRGRRRWPQGLEKSAPKIPSPAPGARRWRGRHVQVVVGEAPLPVAGRPGRRSRSAGGSPCRRRSAKLDDVPAAAESFHRRRAVDPAEVDKSHDPIPLRKLIAERSFEQAVLQGPVHCCNRSSTVVPTARRLGS